MTRAVTFSNRQRVAAVQLDRSALIGPDDSTWDCSFCGNDYCILAIGKGGVFRCCPVCSAREPVVPGPLPASAGAGPCPGCGFLDSEPIDLYLAGPDAVSEGHRCRRCGAAWPATAAEAEGGSIP